MAPYSYYSVVGVSSDWYRGFYSSWEAGCHFAMKQSYSFLLWGGVSCLSTVGCTVTFFGQRPGFRVAAWIGSFSGAGLCRLPSFSCIWMRGLVGCARGRSTDLLLVMNRRWWIFSSVALAVTQALMTERCCSSGCCSKRNYRTRSPCSSSYVSWTYLNQSSSPTSAYRRNSGTAPYSTHHYWAIPALPSSYPILSAATWLWFRVTRSSHHCCSDAGAGTFSNCAASPGTSSSCVGLTGTWAPTAALESSWSSLCASGWPRLWCRGGPVGAVSGSLDLTSPTASFLKTVVRESC